VNGHAANPADIEADVRYVVKADIAGVLWRGSIWSVREQWSTLRSDPAKGRPMKLLSHINDKVAIEFTLHELHLANALIQEG
jgi:hypothetical protein